MSAPGLKPIPTPLPQRLHQIQRAWVPGVVLLGALVAIGCLWQQRVGVSPIVGQADAGRANVSSPQASPGMPEAQYQTRSAVQWSNPVPTFDSKKLEAELAEIRLELAALRGRREP